MCIWELWSPDLKNSIIAKFKGGAFIKDIAEELKLRRIHVSALINNQGLETNQSKRKSQIMGFDPTPEQIKERGDILKQKHYNMMRTKG